MTKRPCPHCNVPHAQTHSLHFPPIYDFELDEYQEPMFCGVCEGEWIRIYKPSSDIKKE